MLHSCLLLWGLVIHVTLTSAYPALESLRDLHTLDTRSRPELHQDRRLQLDEIIDRLLTSEESSPEGADNQDDMDIADSSDLIITRKRDDDPRLSSRSSTGWYSTHGRDLFGAPPSVGQDVSKRHYRYNSYKRRNCNLSKLTLQNFVEYIRTGRLCGHKVGRIRFGPYGRK